MNNNFAQKQQIAARPPQAVSIDNTSVGMSSISKQYQPGSIHEALTNIPQHLRGSMDGSEYGLPQTEEAGDLPTMAQMSLNFNVSNHQDSRHESQRSGVFGGYNQSGLSSANPSFSRENQMGQSQRSSNRVQRTSDLGAALQNSETLKKLATQRPSHSRKDTFGGQTTTSSNYNVPSPKTLTKIHQVDEASIVSGSDEEEIAAQDGVRQGSGELDQDLEFIDEVLATHAEEMQMKTSVLQHVQVAIEKGKKKIPEQIRDTTISEVKNLEESFKKIIGMASFLMENVRKFSDQVGAYQAENAQLEHTKAQMQEQVMYMQDDWKREQEVVRRLDQDLKFKEDQLQRTQDSNSHQASVIAGLQNDLKMESAAVKNLQLRLSQRPSRPTVVEQEKQDDSQARSIEELRQILAERVEELDQANSDVIVLSETAQNLEVEKNEIAEQLDQVFEELNEKVQKLLEYENLIDTMGEKLKEHEDFREALEKQKLKEKIVADTGIDPSAMGGSSNSSFTDTSQFTNTLKSRQKSNGSNYEYRAMSTNNSRFGDSSNLMMKSQQIKLERVRNTDINANINVADVDDSQNYGLDEDVSLQGAGAFVGQQHPLTPNATDRHKMMGGFEKTFGDDHQDGDETSQIPDGENHFQNIQESVHASGGLGELDGMDNNMLSLNMPGGEYGQADANGAANSSSVNNFMDMSGHESSMVNAKGMSFDAVSQAELPKVDGYQTNNSAFNVVTMDGKQPQQDMDPRGVETADDPANMRHANQQQVNALTSFGHPISVSQSAQSPFKSTNDVLDGQEPILSEEPVLSSTGKPRNMPPIMNLNIEVEEAEPDLSETLEFQKLRSGQKDNFASHAQLNVDNVIQSQTLDQSFHDVASHYSAYMRDKQVLQSQDFYNIDRVKLKQEASRRSKYTKMPTNISIPDDSIGDVSVGASMLRESLIATEIKHGRRTRAAYDPPTSLRISMKQQNSRPGTPTGRNIAYPGKRNAAQDGKTPEPKSALVPGTVKQIHAFPPGGYTGGRVMERDNQTMIGLTNSRTQQFDFTPETKRDRHGKKTSNVRRSATPKANQQRPTQFQFANVDRYVDRINRLQVGQKKGGKVAKEPISVTQSVALIHPNHITDKHIMDFDMRASHELRICEQANNDHKGQSSNSQQKDSRLITEIKQQQQQKSENKQNNHLTVGMGSPIQEEKPPCNNCGIRSNSIANSSSNGTEPGQSPQKQSNRRTTNIAKRDAAKEFFGMTLIAQIMNMDQTKQKQLIEIQKEQDKLYKECQTQGIPFFKMGDWISDHIDTQLKARLQLKKSRLGSIFQRGNTKLLERVEEKKLKDGKIKK